MTWRLWKSCDQSSWQQQPREVERGGKVLYCLSFCTPADSSAWQQDMGVDGLLSVLYLNLHISADLKKGVEDIEVAQRPVSLITCKI